MKSSDIIGNFEISPGAMEMMTAPLENIAQRVAVLAAGCIDREPEQLTDQERVALAVLGGCDWEMTETGLRITDAFAVQKIDGRWIVGRSAQRRGAGQ